MLDPGYLQGVFSGHLNFQKRLISSRPVQSAANLTPKHLCSHRYLNPGCILRVLHVEGVLHHDRDQTKRCHGRLGRNVRQSL